MKNIEIKELIEEYNLLHDSSIYSIKYDIVKNPKIEVIVDVFSEKDKKLKLIFKSVITNEIVDIDAGNIIDTLDFRYNEEKNIYEFYIRWYEESRIIIESKEFEFEEISE